MPKTISSVAHVIYILAHDPDDHEAYVCHRRTVSEFGTEKDDQFYIIGEKLDEMRKTMRKKGFTFEDRT